MEYNHDKIDEMILALLWLTRAGDHRTWKSHDWDALDRLHAKGYISDPKSKAKSVVFSEEGERRARELFERHYGRPDVMKTGDRASQERVGESSG
jgi:hypothetical protein